MKRHVPSVIININGIRRHTFRKQDPKRLDVTDACGIVDGCHRVRPSEPQLEGQAKSSKPTAIYGPPSEIEQPDTAQRCAEDLVRREA